MTPAVILSGEFVLWHRIKMQNGSNNCLKKVFIKFTPPTRIGGSQGQCTKRTEKKCTFHGHTMHRSTHPGTLFGKGHPTPLGLSAPSAGASPCQSPKFRGDSAGRAPPGRRRDSPSRRASSRSCSRRLLLPANGPLRPLLRGRLGAGRGGPLGFGRRREGDEDSGGSPPTSRCRLGPALTLQQSGDETVHVQLPVRHLVGSRRSFPAAGTRASRRRRLRRRLGVPSPTRHAAVRPGLRRPLFPGTLPPTPSPASRGARARGGTHER